MTKILIGDDHRIVREGLKQVLADAPDLQVVGEAQTGLEVLALVPTLLPTGLDMVLLDIAMPGRDGLDVLQELRTTWPTLPVLMLSTYPEKQYAVRCIKLGAAGYLNKSADPDDMVAAVRKVASGGIYVTPTIAEALASALGGAATKMGLERNWCTTALGAQYREHLPSPHPGKNRHQERCGAGLVCPALRKSHPIDLLLGLFCRVAPTQGCNSMADLDACVR
jgi:DNA-binding NarL/FixJ family response regulator